MAETEGGAADAPAGTGPGPGGRVEIQVNKKKIEVGAAELGRVTVVDLLERAGYAKDEVDDYDLFVAGGGYEPLGRDGPAQIKGNEQLRAIRKSNPYGR